MVIYILCKKFDFINELVYLLINHVLKIMIHPKIIELNNKFDVIKKNNDKLAKISSESIKSTRHLQRIVSLQLENNLDTTHIIFDDCSAHISTYIIIENIPYFKSLFGSNLMESQLKEVTLPGFSKNEFRNCLLFTIFNYNVKTFNQIKCELKAVSSNKVDDVFINHLSTLKSYYDKFDYLGIIRGCEYIIKIVSKQYISNKLIELEDRNIFFEITEYLDNNSV